MALAGVGVLLVALVACARSVGWVPDLVANLSGQLFVFGVCVLVAAGVARSWVGIAGAGLGSALLLVLMVPGRAGVAAAAPADGTAIRLLVANVRAANSEPGRLAERLAASGAEIVVLTEVGGTVNQAIRGAETLVSQLPYRAVLRPMLDSAPRIVVLSAWPIEDREAEQVPGVGVYAVGHPEGPLGVVAFHAVSPRSASDWRVGLGRAVLVAERASRLGGTGMPVVAAGDLNATPGGHRSALVHELSGFRRAKPILTPAGTYPGGLPGVLRLPIDAVFVSPGVGVVGWETVDLPGSDHAGVMVTLLPGGGGDRPADGR